MACLNFEGDSVEHSSVTFDGPPIRGEFYLRNVLFALIVESGSAEVAEGPNGTVGFLMFYHNTESICAYTCNEPEYS